MMGPENEVDGIVDSSGVIPRFCQELIERVTNTNNDSGIECFIDFFLTFDAMKINLHNGLF